jgi:ubiquinone/menaquinone biosynthesis C-methylase UbiE
MKRTNIPAVGSPAQYHRFAQRGTRALNNILISRIVEENVSNLSRPLRMLDIGTGTGHLLLEVASDSRFSYWSLIGIDIDPAMISFAQQEVDQLNLSHRVEMHVGDVHSLPIAEESVDVVIGRSVVHHWADPSRAFREVFRILRGGGCMLIHEPTHDPDPDALASFDRERQAAGLPRMTIDEKYTIPQLKEILYEAELPVQARIEAGTGLAALGCEIFLRKGVESQCIRV